MAMLFILLQGLVSYEIVASVKSQKKDYRNTATNKILLIKFEVEEG
jgi:hypothetical protein